MTEYNTTQSKYRDRCKDRIQRQLEISESSEHESRHMYTHTQQANNNLHITEKTKPFVSFTYMCGETS